MTTQTLGGARNAPWPVTVPLPSGTPPGIPGGLTMTPKELVDESAIQNVVSRNAASLLRTITLPAYQVLVTSTPTPHINKPPYRISQWPLNESGRRGAEVWGWRGERMTGLILDTWKNGWIYLKGGVRTDTGLSTLEMMHGPTNLGLSLRGGSLKGRSWEDNQTVWPHT